MKIMISPVNETNMTRIWNKHKQPFDPAQGKANTPLKRKIFVGVSGGVDSAVAALLLKEQGYDVTGVYMVNWTDTEDISLGYCTTDEDRRDALKVCEKLGIPFLVFNFEREYRRRVIDYLFREYKRGRTPNPDIMCNKYIKFDLFWREATARGAHAIATGHYAKLVFGTPHQLFIPKDKHKDQTYFLATLNQRQLGHVLFPLAELTKSEVREIARKNSLHISEKKDSQGICFVGQVAIFDFLKKRLAEKRGDVLDTSGKVIGWHRGAYFYTIGQRHGFCVKHDSSNTEPCYVVARDVKKNVLVVAARKNVRQLTVREIQIEKFHWISGQKPKLPIQCKARIRHGQELQRVEARTLYKGCIKVLFSGPQFGVASGQFLVLYSKLGEVLGSGMIQ